MAKPCSLFLTVLLMAAPILVALSELASREACAAEASIPSVERVDYSKPKQALVLNKEFGGEKELRAIAKGLPGKTPVEKLQAIDEWIHAGFAYNGDHAYAWRDFARMRADKTYGGCADLALLFGSLARAAGIPTVFVKSMDYAWIRAFVRGPEPRRWSGHCFLEVHIEGRWMLLDASQMSLYRTYTTDARLAPGGRYIYDKGLDPYAMVKSVRWELWKKQTRAYFKDFDLSKLPVDGSQALRASSGPFSIVGEPANVGALKARIAELGGKVGLIYSHEFEKWIPPGTGGWIFVLAPGKKPVLPAPYLKALLRGSYEDLLQRMETNSSGIFGRTTSEGTRFFVLWGKDDADLDTVVRSVALKEPKAARE